MLLSVCCIANSEILAAPSDTLIVDGKKVVVNRVVEYDTVSVREFRDPSEVKRPRNAVPWLLGLEGGATANISQFQSDLNTLLTVDEFTNRKLRYSVGVNALFYGGIILSDNWSVMTGVGYNSLSMPYSTFDSAQLHDSLYRFESESKGELSQITRYDYGDLGAELDTIQVSLSDENLELSYLEFPLLFNYTPQFRQSKWNLDFQFGVQAQILLDSSTPDVPVIAENGDNEFVPESGQRLTSTLFGVQGAAGFSRRLLKNLEGYGRIRMSLPLNNPSDPVSRIQINFYQVGIQLGVRYLFKP